MPEATKLRLQKTLTNHMSPPPISPLISIVVPCWNIENYISKCIVSILNQSYKNLEIIFVDDKSTDSTISIIKSFASNEKRIRIIERETNGGLGECRNSGILAATGELITFVDGDDELAPNTYEEVIKHYDPTIDVYWFGTRIIYDNNHNHEFKESDLNYYTIKHSGLYSISPEHLTEYDCSAWNKVYKRSLINNDFLFQGRYFEDACFFMRFFALPRNIFFINKQLYIYHRRTSSIMSNTFAKKEGYAIHHIYILDSIRNFWINSNLLPKHRKSFQRIVLDFFRFAYRFSPAYDRARVVNEMAVRLRQWDIGSEISPLLDEIRLGKYEIIFGTSKHLSFFAKIKLFLGFNNRKRRASI